MSATDSSEEGLLEFLAEQSQDGETVARSDHFTLSPEQAWEKLSAHALPFEEAWVTEIVRAAVLSGCESIEIKQSSSRTMILLPRIEAWQGDQVLDSLLNFGSGAAPYYRHLAVAFRSLAKVLGNPFSVYTEGKRIFSWTGKEINLELGAFDLAEGQAPASNELLISISNSADEDRGFFSKIFKMEERSFMTGVSRILHSRAFCSPIPITLDSRSVRGLQAYLTLSRGNNTRPLMHFRAAPSKELPAFRSLLMEAWEKPSSELPITIVGRGEARPDASSVLRELQAMEDSPAGMVVVLTAFLKRVQTNDSFFQSKSKTWAWQPGEGRSKLLWLQDGVVIEEEDLHSGGFGLLVMVSSEGLKSDISGYKLVRNKEFEARRRHALKLASELVYDSLSSKYFEHSQEVTMGSFELMFRAIWGVAGLFLVIPGVLCFLDLAYGVSKIGKLREECEKAFEEEFNSLSEQLETYRR